MYQGIQHVNIFFQKISLKVFKDYLKLNLTLAYDIWETNSKKFPSKLS
jgi:hypothetical protein